MNQKSEEEIRHAIAVYGNLLYRMAYVHLGNIHDVQDVLQPSLQKILWRTLFPTM